MKKQLLCVALTLVLGLGLFCWAGWKGRAACVTRMKELELALEIYTTRDSGLYPDKLDATVVNPWMDTRLRGVPHVDKQYLLTCPNGCRYSYAVTSDQRGYTITCPCSHAPFRSPENGGGRLHTDTF